MRYRSKHKKFKRFLLPLEEKKKGICVLNKCKCEGGSNRAFIVRCKKNYTETSTKMVATEYEPVTKGAPA